MHLRPLVLTTAFAVSALAGCNLRDELAPWGFAEDVRLQCESPADGQVGVTYSWTPSVLAGDEPLSFAVDPGTPLPMGLAIDAATGTISGTPTEGGSFPLTLLVTDARDNTFTITCGPIDIAEGATIQCGDGMGGDIPDAFVGLPYTFEVTAVGGRPPYAGWTDNMTLPPGLAIAPVMGSPDKALISGTPTTAGTYNVDLEVTDNEGTLIAAMCGELVVRDPISVDPEALLGVFPDGCVPHGVTLDQLIADGVVIPIPGAADPTCHLKTGRGNGDRNFDGDANTPNEFPPGIAVDTTTCELSGTVSPSLRYGVYAWITTLEQAPPSYSIPAVSEGWLPYCAPQMVPAQTAYEVVREAGNPLADKTFAPGVVLWDPDAPDLGFTYGDNTPDPVVTVTYDEQCAGACFYAYIFTYNALSGMATVSASPSSKFPANGFEGFTHGIQITETDDAFLDTRRRRAFVTNISYDYCIAQNNTDCGNNLGNTPAEQMLKGQLIRENGGNSNYEFGLVVLPM